MTITTLPNDMLQETFQHLTMAQLRPMALASKWSYESVQHVLRARLPGIPDECLFRSVGWREEGFKGLERRMVDFISRNPLPGKVSCLKVTFDNCPEAHITVWMGDGVTFPCTLLQSSGEIQAALESTSKQVVEERYVVFGGVVQNLCDRRAIRSPEAHLGLQAYRVHYGVTAERDLLPQYNDGLMGCLRNDLHFSPVSYLPDRWYWTNHARVVGWGQDQAFQNVCSAAEERIYELDCESLQPENMVKRAAHYVATAASAAFAGITAAVTILQHLQ